MAWKTFTARDQHMMFRRGQVNCGTLRQPLSSSCLCHVQLVGLVFAASGNSMISCLFVG